MSFFYFLSIRTDPNAPQIIRHSTTAQLVSWVRAFVCAG
jgi:hypothetical protein